MKGPIKCVYLELLVALRFIHKAHLLLVCIRRLLDGLRCEAGGVLWAVEEVIDGRHVVRIWTGVWFGVVESGFVVI